MACFYWSSRDLGKNEESLFIFFEKKKYFVIRRNEDPSMLVSGAVSQGDKDYSPEAAKIAHSKPQPTREKPPQKGHHGQPQMNLKQPGKH